jgi:hypothetical protein
MACAVLMLFGCPVERKHFIRRTYLALSFSFLEDCSRLEESFFCVVAYLLISLIDAQDSHREAAVCSLIVTLSRARTGAFGADFFSWEELSHRSEGSSRELEEEDSRLESCPLLRLSLLFLAVAWEQWPAALSETMTKEPEKKGGRSVIIIIVLFCFLGGYLNL